MTDAEQRATEALLSLLPPPKPCGMCRGREFDGVTIEKITPTLGRTELCDGGDIDAAIFSCRLCGAVETIPLAVLVEAEMGDELLTHYVVVRRDLPMATICAQLVHAAGESFYQLQLRESSLRSADSSLSEAAGLNPASEATSSLNSSGPKGHGAGDGASAERGTVNPEGTGSTPVSGSIRYGREEIARTVAVVMGARNEGKLLKLERKLVAARIPHVAIREPDAPWNGALMAIGLVPGSREKLSRMVNEFHLLKFEPAA